MKPNKGVQGTLHKVSGPLTPDVGLRKMGYSAFKGPSTTVKTKSIDRAETISECEARNSHEK